MDDQQAQKQISESFPSKDLSSMYQLYYKFPRGSTVCIKKHTKRTYSIDTYSRDLFKGFDDFISVLKRLMNMKIKYSISYYEIEYEEMSKRYLFEKALIEKRGIILILPVMLSTLIKYFIGKYNIIYALSDLVVGFVTLLIFLWLFIDYERRWRGVK